MKSSLSQVKNTVEVSLTLTFQQEVEMSKQATQYCGADRNILSVRNYSLAILVGGVALTFMTSIL